jgi:hypothetical protein
MPTPIAGCEYAKALDLARQLIDLEPQRGIRRKFQVIEKLLSGGGRTQTPESLRLSRSPKEDDEETLRRHQSRFALRRQCRSSRMKTRTFIVDIELLEKFGQHASAIVAGACSAYPHEIRLQQLKTICLDRK